MSHTCDIARTNARRSRLPRLADLAALYRQRRSLSRLDTARLDDLGLSADEAHHEATRPFWDVPAHWLR